MTLHAELMLRMAGTDERRAASRPRVLALLERVDLPALRESLQRQRLLPLIGTRLAELAPDALDEEFLQAIDRSVAAARHQSVLFEEVTLRLLANLERAQIPALALKGPILSRRLYGDPGRRSISADIDLLVAPDCLAAAGEELGRAGYARPQGAAWADGLPLFEQSLPPEAAWLPRLDLHWRIHWYEREFSECLLERSQVNAAGVRLPAPADELATLILMYSRDGFWGLRLLADIAAWWDRYGHRLAPGALDPIAQSHPELRPALAASARACDWLVGLPSGRLLADQAPRRRSVLAAKLANWSAEGSPRQYSANVTLVDWLLVPRGGQRSFARRHVVLPRSVIATMYGLPEEARVKQSWRQLWHSAVFTRHTLGPWSRAFWRTRFGHERPLVPS